MKKAVFIFLLFITACSVKFYLYLGNGRKYFLTDDEKFYEVDTVFLHFYQKHIDYDSAYQLPLYSVIAGGKTLNFFGFAVYDDIWTVAKHFAQKMPDYDSLIYKNRIYYFFLNDKEPYFLLVLYSKQKRNIFQVQLKNKRDVPVIVAMFTTDLDYLRKLKDDKKWVLERLR